MTEISTTTPNNAGRKDRLGPRQLRAAKFGLALTAVLCFCATLAPRLAGQAGGRRRVTADPAVVRRLTSADHRERRAAYMALSQSGTPVGADEVFPSILEALKLESAYDMEREQRGEFRDDEDAGYYESLIYAAGRLRDKRAINALALAAATIAGVEQSYLADMAPDSVPALIELTRKPSSYFGGHELAPWAPGFDSLRMTLLRRGAFDNAPEQRLAVIRELVANLDDSNPVRRGMAVDGLFPLRHDPVIRARLEAIAANDPETATRTNGLWYPVRERTRAILNPPGGDKEWWVARSADAGACRLERVDPGAESKDALLGPYPDQTKAESGMCRDYVRESTNPKLCQKVPESAYCHN